MNYQELQKALGLDDKEIMVTIIKPIRDGEVYKTGQVLGLKPGLFGGGYSDWKKDKQQRDGRGMAHPHSFNSLDMHWIKKPKVLVVYNAFTFGRSLHCDWVEVDNCEFEIKSNKVEQIVDKIEGFLTEIDELSEPKVIRYYKCPKCGCKLEHDGFPYWLPKAEGHQKKSGMKLCTEKYVEITKEEYDRL